MKQPRFDTPHLLIAAASVSGPPQAFDANFHAITTHSSRTTKRFVSSNLELVPSGAARQDQEVLSRVIGMVRQAHGDDQPGPRLDPESDEWKAYVREREREWRDHFGPRGYSMASCELNLEVGAAMLVDVLRLQPHDRFVDLGSSRGRLVLLAACGSDADEIAGVEMSPRRHKEACSALQQLRETNPHAAERIHLTQGDLLEAPLDRYTVIYCAVQPSHARKIMGDFLRALRQKHVAQAAAAATRNQSVTVRVLCAGFDLPLNVAGTTPSLRRCYIFGPLTSHRAGEPAVRGSALYGTRGEGPRTVLEYEVLVSLSDSEPATSESDEARRAVAASTAHSEPGPANIVDTTVRDESASVGLSAGRRGAPPRDS